MGQGIDAAREDAPLHAAVLDNFKDQLLIAFVRQQGGEVSIPVAEVDETGGFNLMMPIHNGAFNFKTVKKQ